MPIQDVVSDALTANGYGMAPDAAWWDEAYPK